MRLGPLSLSPPSSIVTDILGKAPRPVQSENTAFQRLWGFSGSTPTSAGEETLDPWLMQARLMVDECSESEK